MADRKIGIKVADGTFYPILDEGRRQKKRLVLTTVNDNQENVQIDLYRGEDGSLEEAEYIGSLLVEHIKGAQSGEPDIEVTIGTDEEGNLETTAEDRGSGERQSLNVSLKDLSAGGLYDVPEFSLTDEDEEQELSSSFDESFDELEEEEEGESEELEEFAMPEEEALFDEEEEPDFGLEESGATEESAEEGELPDFGEEPEDEESESDFSADFENEFPDVEEPEEYGPQEEEGEEESEGWEDEIIEEEARQGEGESKRRPLLVALLVLLTLALLGALLYLVIFVAGSEEPAGDLQARDNGGIEQPAEEPDAAEPEASGEEEGPDAEEAGGAGTAGEPDAEAERSPEEQSPETGGAAESAEAGADAEAASQSPDSQSADSAPMELEKENGGVWYRIRWGDTLWELSYSFYDTPWLYGEIAEQNRIANPDRIFAQDRIFIPEDPAADQ